MADFSLALIGGGNGYDCAPAFSVFIWKVDYCQECFFSGVI